MISYGAILVKDGKLNVGQLISFVLYTTYIALGLSEFSGLYSDFSNALGASERVLNIMSIQPKILSKRQGFIPKSCLGQVDFEHVVFKYPTREASVVLEDCNLTILPNQTIAICGVSGIGKSTILCLLERFYDVTDGRILLDGVDIKTLDSQYLHSKISIVAQEPCLTSGSIRSNIAFSKISSNLPYSDEDVRTAAKRANCHEFICSFPDGYDTIVGEKGVRLSGGIC